MFEQFYAVNKQHYIQKPVTFGSLKSFIPHAICELVNATLALQPSQEAFVIKSYPQL